jgi:hypothetical protein
MGVNGEGTVVETSDFYVPGSLITAIKRREQPKRMTRGGNGFLNNSSAQPQCKVKAVKATMNIMRTIA